MADVTLPQLGEAVTEGTITRWFKQIGDTVAADEPLFEVSTDKVDTEVPSPVAGTLNEIRAQEGDTVPVGTVIAVVGDAASAPAAGTAAQTPDPEGAAAPAEAEPVVEAPPAAAPAPVVEAPPVAAPAPVVEAPPVAAPAPAAPVSAAAPAAPSGAVGDKRLLSPVVRRLVTEHNLDTSSITGTGPGGRITRDDVLDHIDQLGGTVPAVSTEPPAAAAAQVPPAVPAPAAPAPQPVAVPAAAPQPLAATAPRPSPVQQPAAAIAGDHDRSIKLTKIRRLTGAHMVMSKAVSPHAFSVVEVDYANVDVTRNAVKAEWKAAEGFGLTYLPFITRAVVEALEVFPLLNASLGENDIVVHSVIDMGIAVDLDYEGLIVPVIRAAEGKRLRAIAREISDLAARAHSKRLGPDEISGGTFTITNNGSAGSVLTMPIINQPQVAILSTDAIVRKPVVGKLADGGEAIVIHPVGNLSMAWDHRVYDGAYAAGFLVKIKDVLETRDWSAEL
ncbi:MAG: dihydrolipoamide acetyltransferase family protein [Ilumatobacteraceae bacterium]